ncbi:periplasmic binding protein [Denitrovibrio acetiphilus DSM 12809]|uniref:Periplasmic binding protein n=1 Tax=Denitrovibrio acetiphilus (strain DSM 12809 / NBRC 114555 / N2460) TaxID=522772 RepID=D4H6P8_DENA2|nr:ABC transporter substrate-binding protein [Denitrovibrio acetiphilus]ADD67764.1 periplasmic binding protein [Denitrovibrio acetiphilus DSM 12809]
MGKLILFIAVSVTGILFSQDAYGAVVTDLLNRKVQIPDKIINRIVPLKSSMSFISFLGAQDKVVGIEAIDRKDYEKRPYVYDNKEKLKDVTIVSEGGAKGRPSHELIISLKPDVVFTITSDPAEADMLQRKLKTPVVVLSFGYQGVEFETVFRSLNLAGLILNKQKRAEYLISYISGLQTELDYRPDKKVRAYVGGLSYKGVNGIDSTEGHFLPFRLAGVENTADSIGRKGHIFLQKEYLALMNPELIFIDSAGYGIISEKAKKEQGFYSRLSAFKNGQVYQLPANTYYFINIDLMLANAFFIAKTAYPDYYKELDAEEKAGEIIKVFTGQNLYHVIKQDTGGFKRVVQTKTGMSLKVAN